MDASGWRTAHRSRIALSADVRCLLSMRVADTGVNGRCELIHESAYLVWMLRACECYKDDRSICSVM